MLTAFSKIVVDKKNEIKFRHRALKEYPQEYIESLWGIIRGDTLYICIFMPMECKKVTPTSIEFHEGEEEFDHQEDEAKEYKLEFIGTIHTHPNRDTSVCSDGDIHSCQETNEMIMGVMNIPTLKEGKKYRRCSISYWPCVRPLEVIRKEVYK
jgi:proteasome lid subunit RPN8/RPN11